MDRDRSASAPSTLGRGTPVYHLSCDRCDAYGQSSIAMRRRYWFLSDRRRCPIPQQVAWCEDCGRFAAMEWLPEPDTLRKARALARLPRLARAVLARFRQEEWRRLDKAWGLVPRPPDPVALALTPGADFSILARIVESGRPPVCLHCAGRRAMPLALPAPDTHPHRYTVPLIAGHGACDGRVAAVLGRNMMLDMPRREISLHRTDGSHARDAVGR